MTAPRRRWLRFSLRTMFVVVTVLACWMAYQLNWIRARNAILAEANYAGVVGSGRHAERGWVLAIFHEPPIDYVAMGSDVSDEEFSRLRWLFPEADIVRSDEVVSPDIEIIESLYDARFPKLHP